MSFRLTPQAENEARQIYNDGVDNWGIQQAKKYAARLERAFNFLATNPDAGSDASEIIKGFRKHVVQKHIVYYQKVGSDIEIVAILGARMDPDQYFITI